MIVEEPISKCTNEFVTEGSDISVDKLTEVIKYLKKLNRFGSNRHVVVSNKYYFKHAFTVFRFITFVSNKSFSDLELLLLTLKTRDCTFDFL